MKRDIHQEITDKVIEQMQSAGTDWLKPFAGQTMPINGVTKKPYRGINTFALMLWGQSESNQYASYKQWQSVGGQVRKGSSAVQIVFFKPMETESKNSAGEKSVNKWALIRYSNVFRREDVDGLPELEQPPVNDPAQRVENCEAYLKATGATIQNRVGEGAYYSPAKDVIVLPPREAFLNTADGNSTEHYYSTAFHELTHWTGNKTRLDRLKTCARFGSQPYAFEELIAEMGAAIQCGTMGIDNQPRADHAKYLNNWLKCLSDDPKAIFKAAAEAQKAVQYIEDLQDNQQAGIAA